MALYTYTIHLLREGSAASFVEDLTRAGLIRVQPNDVVELLGIQMDVSFNDREGGFGLIRLYPPDDPSFDKFLAEKGDELLAWFWRALSDAKLLYAFIPGGGDYPYYEDGIRTDQLVWRQLGELFQTGRVRIAHPLMMFAERLGNGAPCRRVRAASPGTDRHREGLGCLVLIADERGRGFEILEPGTMYPVFRKRWD